MTGVLYKITNTLTGKGYVGITTGKLARRWADHLWAAKNGSTPLYRAIRKYGKSVFNIEVIATYSDHCALKEAEIEAIKEHLTHVSEFGYNVTRGGDGTLGRFPSAATVLKLRDAAIRQMARPGAKEHLSACARKQFSDPSARKRISEVNLGRIHTLETRNKVRVAMLGRPVSQATRSLLSNSRKGIKRPISVVEKIRKARLGSRHSMNARLKMSLARRGKPKSEQHKAGLKAGWETRRARAGGTRGVSRYKHGWQVHIYRNGKSRYVGKFVKFEDAIAAHAKADIENVS